MFYAHEDLVDIVAQGGNFLQVYSRTVIRLLISSSVQ